MESKVDWNLTHDQKNQLLDLLNSLGSHSVYPVNYIKEKLIGCGVPVKINEINTELLVGSERVKQINPEFGKAGIYPMHLLAAAIKDYGYKDEINSDMTGIGFYYRDLLEQLAFKWGIPKSFL